MKFVLVILIFAAGIAIGRWSAPKPTSLSASPDFQKVEVSDISHDPTENAQAVEPAGKESVESVTAETEIVQGPVDQKFSRTNAKADDRRMRELFSLTMTAMEKGQVEEQNRLFQEMLKQDPKHEKVFEAKTMFLQDDEDWTGAHEVLKECVHTIPTSLFCLRRLSNIRSSSLDEKINFGEKCLEVSPRDPLCLVDLATALFAKGELERSKSTFETALKLPPTGEGFDRSYVLFQYANLLEQMRLDDQSRKALKEACRLNLKPACDKLKG